MLDWHLFLLSVYFYFQFISTFSLFLLSIYFCFQFWNIVPLEHLLVRLEIDDPPVCRRIMKLLFSNKLKVEINFYCLLRLKSIQQSDWTAVKTWQLQFNCGRCTILCDKVCQWLAAVWWFSLGTPVSSTNKTDCYSWIIVESSVKHHYPNPAHDGLCTTVESSSLEILSS
jgi:hypothetical protein